MGNTAFRAVSVACAQGIAGQAVALADKNEDLVYVPDQPNFTFASGVTVAGWFNHAALDETRTLFRKRDGGNQRVRPGAEEPEVRVRRQPGHHGRQRDLPRRSRR